MSYQDGSNQDKKPRFNYTAPQDLIEQDIKSGHHDEVMPEKKVKIADREDSYLQRKKLRVLSPERHDPFSNIDKTPDINARTYSEIMIEQRIENERQDVIRKIAKQKEENLKQQQEKRDQKKPIQKQIDERERSTSVSTRTNGSDWESADQGKIIQSSKWDTPHRVALEDMTPGKKSRWDMTPLGVDASDQTPGRQVIGETPTPGRTGMMGETPGTARYGETPTPKRAGKSRWDDKTPVLGVGSTPSTFGGYTPTPGGGMTPSMAGMTPEKLQMLRWEKEMDERNRPLTDEELDQILPTQGYEIVTPPEGYKAVRVPSKKLQGTPQQIPGQETPSYYNIPDQSQIGKPYEIPGTPVDGPNAMPSIKPEDLGYFGALLNQQNESDLSVEEQKERKIMMLLLKIKNGTPPMRKSALRQITINAKELGAGALFNQILPLLMSPTLEDQERHLLVKVVDRVLYKLDDLVRPYVHKILVVIEPLLIDEDYYARVEGREIISNLAKAAGLATMISTMRPDIDHSDEYVRNTTARAFAVVASALGIPALLPFLKAVCQSKKSWQARHTGIKIIQQIAILMGCAVLPHLKKMVEIIENGLKDEQQKVRTITALAIAGLAEAATPYGIEAFESVLIPLWDGINMHRSKGLAAFLKAIGFIIPLMDTEHAGEYTKEVMPILIREFQNPEEEMKKIVLKVVKQCVATDGVEAQYVRETVIPEFFRNFWIRRMALDKRNYSQLVDTTVEIAAKVGGATIINKIVDDLKDENEPYRKMVMETIEQIIAKLGVADIGSRLEIQLMDGILHAFQEQASDDTMVMLNGFGTVINTLEQRAKPYFSQICGIIQWRLNNKSARIRQQAADLISRVALCMQKCNEEIRLGRLGVMLYECLGEEYPEVLGSILGGLKAIVNVIGMTKMTPPIKDLLPRLTPVLKNRHEKVQENCIDLVGRIADRGAEYVSPKEWMRICFDLLDLLKAHKKGIRRATVNTFGYIAKAIGPQDVLVTLLNNLKVQERQNRVCTTVAIAIVAETCGPFTVLPALMNEYRVPEMNVQNGVLKSLSFMFEYIGEMSKDYVYAITPLLEDALVDRDLVHRQTAASAVKHLALGVHGLDCEDALIHLLNFVFPNIFETSPHVVNAITEAIDALRVSLGTGQVMLYILQGLFHPARRVREVYWKFYNMLYVGGQEPLAAYLPLLENMEQHLKQNDSSKQVYKNYEMYNLL